MAWKRVKDNSNAVGNPVLVGEPGNTHWVDGEGEAIFAQSPDDFPKLATDGQGSNIFPGTNIGGVNVVVKEATLKDVFNEIKDVSKEVKELKGIFLGFINTISPQIKGK